MSDQAVNAGIHAAGGFELQKHCALYLLLDNYNKLKNMDYFVCIEHYDDLVFCFMENGFIGKTQAYQVKKAQTQWTVDEDFIEIVKKVVGVGKALSSSSYIRTDGYKHSLSFMSNKNMKLETKIKNPDGGKPKNITISKRVNEANPRVTFVSLHKEIQQKFFERLLIEKIDEIKELENLMFEFIDLPQTCKAQKHTLVGKCNDVFGERIHDHKSAVETLLLLFRDVENTFNKGGVVNFLDPDKRITSEEINHAFGILTDHAIAYNFWREIRSNLMVDLKISMGEKDAFEADYNDSIDFFKDKTQSEHQKILKFVENNMHIENEVYSEAECVVKLYEVFKAKEHSGLSDRVIKAAIFAAYSKARG